MKTIILYGELKNALPSTGTHRVPGINQLRKKASVILRRETESGNIEIYENGFFTFEERGHLTVYGVDRCEWPETYSPDGRKERGVEPLDLSTYPWEAILESAGAARLSHNADSREESKGDISLDAPDSENNIAFSVRPEHELREEEEEMAEWRAARVKKMKNAVDKLTDKQRTIMMMDRVEHLTQEQIAARMGISRRTLREHLEAIEKKLNKFEKNTRHFTLENLE